MMNTLKGRKEKKKLLKETCIDGYMEESIDRVDVFELYLIGILQERELRETAPEEK